MKAHLLLLFFSIIVFECYAQDNKPTKNKIPTNLSFINNKTTKHAIVMMACRNCAPIRSVGYRVVVTLSEREQEIIKNISSETWVKLLNSDSTDFSANLILYSLYDKDAIVLSLNNSKLLWRSYLKKEDLAFWNAKFKLQNKATR